MMDRDCCHLDRDCLANVDVSKMASKENKLRLKLSAEEIGTLTDDVIVRMTGELRQNHLETLILASCHAA